MNVLERYYKSWYLSEHCTLSKNSDTNLLCASELQDIALRFEDPITVQDGIHFQLKKCTIQPAKNTDISYSFSSTYSLSNSAEEQFNLSTESEDQFMLSGSNSMNEENEKINAEVNRIASVEEMLDYLNDICVDDFIERRIPLKAPVVVEEHQNRMDYPLSKKPSLENQGIQHQGSDNQFIKNQGSENQVSKNQGSENQGIKKQGRLSFSMENKKAECQKKEKTGFMAASDPRLDKKKKRSQVRGGDVENDEPNTMKRKFAVPSNKEKEKEEEELDPRLNGCDPKLIERIELEIVDRGDSIGFDDIAGLEFAKQCVTELILYPMKRPDLFTGLRKLPKGLLLFGPPGTGKTLIGKAIANQSGATFFSISASSLTSKWIGEGEKLVKTLFAVAAVHQPSVVFIDEIDSLLTQRSSEENEASRRMKTEFLVQLDGAGTKDSDVILVVGATNRPQELDEAARRRLVKRLYIPLPDISARRHMITRLLSKNDNSISAEDIDRIVQQCAGYSGADIGALCTEAAMGPIRSIIGMNIDSVTLDDVRPIEMLDFETAFKAVRSSVAKKDLQGYLEWNNDFGSYQFSDKQILEIQ